MHHNPSFRFPSVVYPQGGLGYGRSFLSPKWLGMQHIVPVPTLVSRMRTPNTTSTAKSCLPASQHPPRCIDFPSAREQVNIQGLITVYLIDTVQNPMADRPAEVGNPELLRGTSILLLLEKFATNNKQMRSSWRLAPGPSGSKSTGIWRYEPLSLPCD